MNVDEIYLTALEPDAVAAAAAKVDLKENPLEWPEDEATDDYGIVALFQQIIDYETTKQVRDLASSFVTFISAAEDALPRGMHPGFFKQTVGANEMNQTRSDLAQLREQMLHEVRERSSRMAGWELASMKQIKDNQDDIDGAKHTGASDPQLFWIQHKHNKQPIFQTPQILLWGEKVVYVVGVHSSSSTPDSTKKGKCRLQFNPPKAEHVNKIYVLEAKEVHDKPSGKIGFHFNPVSASHIVQLTKATRENLKQLEVETINEDENGMAITLTMGAIVAVNNHRALLATKQVNELAKAVDAGAKLRLDEHLLQKAPIQYIQDFDFHSEAFMSAPTTKQGSAEARSGLQYAESVRLKSLANAKNLVTDEIMRAWPGYCHRHYYLKNFSGKVTLIQYRLGIAFFTGRSLPMGSQLDMSTREYSLPKHGKGRKSMSPMKYIRFYTQWIR